jgi:hypothetical protein
MAAIKLSIFSDALRLLGIFFLLLILGVLYLAVKLPKTWKGKTASALIIVGWFIAFPGRQAWEAKQEEDAARARFEKSRAAYQERCQTRAGEKIYKTVPGVEGLLLKALPRLSGHKERSDPMWPGGAFALEGRGDDYIRSFLRIPPPYRWVDVVDEKDGKRYRYTWNFKQVTRVSSIMVGGDGKTKRTYMTHVLERTPAPEPAPRYAVTYEDHVIPEDRALGIASSTVTVLDRESGEVLGEMVRYAWYRENPATAEPQLWARAYRCPGYSSKSDRATRTFVEQILIPVQEK